MDLTTPLGRGGTGKSRKKELMMPMITPKFDPKKPLENAREPHHGETLVSLSGSPVVPIEKACKLTGYCMCMSHCWKKCTHLGWEGSNNILIVVGYAIFVS